MGRKIGVLCFFFLMAFSPLQGGKPTLQPHQKYTVDYFLSKPEQKGLLLYHALGSGKTYLSLAYCEEYQSQKVIVMMPRFLKSSWTTQLASFGVKNSQKYEFLDLKDAYRALKDKDLSQTIVVVDEIHKLIHNIRFGNIKENNEYSLLFEKIKTAKKILALSGTPIFDSVSDISFVGNLITGQEQFPYNPETFKEQYTEIKPWTSLLRGYMTESKLVYMLLPTYTLSLSMIALIGLSPMASILIGISGAGIIPTVNAAYPVYKTSFREFIPDKFGSFTSSYVSYFKPREEDQSDDYPKKIVIEKQSHYTAEQVHLFLDLVNEHLSLDRFELLARDLDETYSKEYMNLNSQFVQRKFLSNPSAGREIGNLTLKTSENEIQYSAKFEEILSMIKSTKGNIAVYSNYYHNGIMEFAKFLDLKGLKNEHAILDPDLSTEDQTRRLEVYNQGQKRILLIHPEITEGISLKGTEQFHILEPITNAALQDQVIGRAVRFKSHEHLPKEQRKVTVYLWESSINYGKWLPTKEDFIRKEHWQNAYSEVHPSTWTKGIQELDPNYLKKEETPDNRVKREQALGLRDMKAFQELVENYSIEHP